MPSVGPQLPASLMEKRKRSEDEESTSSPSSDSPGPQPAKVPANQSPKRQRVLGPTLPPAPLDERPSSPPPTTTEKTDEKDNSPSDSSDDDGFGPALPTAAERTSHLTSTSQPSGSQPTQPDHSVPTKRDEWMTMAPTNGDWSSRVDPTKLKNRKFNTTKGIKGAPTRPSGDGASSADNDAWYETPEQKQERLRREVLGIKPNVTTTTTSTSAAAGTSKGSAGRQQESSRHETQEDRDTARRMKEYTAARGPSLYDAHQQKSQAQEGRGSSREKDDDPSARAFDREKDIGGGMQINSTKRRDMVKKAGGFSDRFGKASYL